MGPYHHDVWPDGHRIKWVLRSLGGEGERTCVSEALGGQCVVASMRVASTLPPFFFHVNHFPARRDLAIATDDASARQLGEAEKANETHTALGCAESKLRAEKWSFGVWGQSGVRHPSDPS
jgi:hypothetical protein